MYLFEIYVLIEYNHYTYLEKCIQTYNLPNYKDIILSIYKYYLFCTSLLIYDIHQPFFLRDTNFLLPSKQGSP